MLVCSPIVIHAHSGYNRLEPERSKEKASNVLLGLMKETNVENVRTSKELEQLGPAFSKALNRFKNWLATRCVGQQHDSISSSNFKCNVAHSCSEVITFFVFLRQLYTNKRGVVQPPFAFASVTAASDLDRILVQIRQVSMYPMQAGEMCAWTN